MKINLAWLILPIMPLVLAAYFSLLNWLVGSDLVFFLTGVTSVALGVVLYFAVKDGKISWTIGKERD